ncbi:hypothetical protein QE152_g1781 [Popillia japonica]|uniref:Craniofacial development protein 2 n=1 Tax=Popillia japonica TaxID=7064 RepID=A0AAW1N3N9_POPJA
MVIGDANAKIGREDIYRRVAGSESKYQYTNYNGLRLINFAIEMKMKIMSTHFPRKEIYKGTWTIPGRKETNQIDHVLVPERYAHSIKNVRTYRGADVDSDHFLVVVKIKELAAERKQRKTKKTEIKYNMEDLKNVIVAEKYSQEIQDSFNKADDINTVESKWKKLEKSIKAATERQQDF